MRRELRGLAAIGVALTLWGCASEVERADSDQGSTALAPARPERPPVEDVRPAREDEEEDFREAPILAKAFLLHVEARRKDDAVIYPCHFQVSELLRGELDPYTERNFYFDLPSLVRNFPWIKDKEYEGAVVFLHMKRRRGQATIVGFSQTATGVVVPLS